MQFEGSSKGKDEDVDMIKSIDLFRVSRAPKKDSFLKLPWDALQEVVTFLSRISAETRDARQRNVESGKYNGTRLV